MDYKAYQWDPIMSMISMNEKLEYFTQIVQNKSELYFPKRIVKFHTWENKKANFIQRNMQSISQRKQTRI